MRKPILLLLVAITIATFAIVGVAPGASAHTTQGNATPANDGWHPWPTDACSTPGININSADFFNFRHACIHHDGCYKGFQNGGRATYWVSRWQCDAWFLYDMQASCRWQHGSDPHHSWSGRQCMQWANNYHWAVRTHARGAYTGPWNN